MGKMTRKGIKRKAEYNRQYYIDNRNKVLAQIKRYYQKNKVKIAKRNKKYYEDNVKRITLRQRKYENSKYDSSVAFRRYKSEKSRREYHALRMEVFKTLGGPRCVECGYPDIMALQIDHIDGGGMKDIRSFSSNKTYMRHIIKNPVGYQVLCANCNRIKVYENNELRRSRYAKKS